MSRSCAAGRGSRPLVGVSPDAFLKGISIPDAWAARGEAGVSTTRGPSVPGTAGDFVRRAISAFVPGTADTSVSETVGTFVPGTAGGFFAETAGTFVSETAGAFLAETAGAFVSEKAGDFIPETATDFVPGAAGAFIPGITDAFVPEATRLSTVVAGRFGVAKTTALDSAFAEIDGGASPATEISALGAAPAIASAFEGCMNLLAP